MKADSISSMLDTLFAGSSTQQTQIFATSGRLSELRMLFLG